MREVHPYGEFIPTSAKAMLIGSFPIAKFSDPYRRHEIKSHEYDFFFGGEKNLLWKLLSYAFSIELHSRDEIKAFLSDQRLALGDVIKSCRRKNGGGSDADLYDIEWNESLLSKISAEGIVTVYFTSKKVEEWFNRLFPDTGQLNKITLISPSAQSVRSLYHRRDFKIWVKNNVHKPKVKFIFEYYQNIFNTKS